LRGVDAGKLPSNTCPEGKSDEGTTISPAVRSDSITPEKAVGCGNGTPTSSSSLKQAGLWRQKAMQANPNTRVTLNGSGSVVVGATPEKASAPQKFRGRCHNCQRLGHKARDCKLEKRTPKKKPQSQPDEIAESVRDAEDKAAAAEDVVKDLITEVAEAHKEVDDIKKEYEEKTKKLEADEAAVTSHLDRARERISNLDIRWRDNNGKGTSLLKVIMYLAVIIAIPLSPLSVAEIREDGSDALMFMLLMYFALVLSATCIILPIVIIVDIIRGKSTIIFQNPLAHHYKFFKWCQTASITNVDTRADAVSLTVTKHTDALYAKVTYRFTRLPMIPFFDRKLRMKVSVEQLSQLGHHMNLSSMLDDLASAVKLDNAAGKLMTVNIDRYWNISEQNVVSNTVRLAYGLRKAQLYRLEEQKVPFPKAGMLVG